MPWYAINTSLMISNLRSSFPTVKQVWFADDSTGAGKLDTLSAWYKHLRKEGMKYGYHVNGSKSWLILKTHELSSAAERAFGEEVNISTEGKRHLGAVIGSSNYKEQFCTEKVGKWKDELEVLSEIAKSQPHAAYAAFTKGFKSKFTFCMRTIESFEDFVDPIHEVIHEMFLPTLFGQEELLIDSLHEVVTLTPNQGGLGIPCLKEDSPQQFAASKLITSRHTESIKDQKLAPLEDSEDLKRQHRSLKATMTKSKIERVDGMMKPEMATYIDQARDKGASAWLNALPIQDQGFALNKQEFRDSIRLRYNLPIRDLPSHCTCGSPFNVNHALSCKKGGFIAQRHDCVRDLFTSLLDKVCKNVQSEPHLLPLDNERLNLKSSITSPEARLDIKAGGFWSKGVTAFFDVRVTHVNSLSNQNKTTAKIFSEQEDEKKRKYQERILNVEMGTFTPLIFGTNGGMGSESKMFLKNLAIKLSNKSGEDYANTITWLRTILCFKLLKTVHLCIRGSRTPFTKNICTDDYELSNYRANIY